MNQSRSVGWRDGRHAKLGSIPGTSPTKARAQWTSSIISYHPFGLVSSYRTASVRVPWEVGPVIPKRFGGTKSIAPHTGSTDEPHPSRTGETIHAPPPRKRECRSLDFYIPKLLWDVDERGRGPRLPEGGPADIMDFTSRGREGPRGPMRAQASRPVFH